ncbi:MAG: hypothetical protein V2I33_19365 [Kangiellaceae bacterium]|jgi:hypothetical protein|nr:hypothetical protein [Kangiellaceae bacterium]
MEELPTLIKSARENAILGMYPESLEQFQKIIVCMDSQTNQSRDERWKKARRDLQEEMGSVTKVY